MRHRGILALALVAASAVTGHPAQAWRMTLLPTQQRVQPIGKQVNLGLFPTGMALSTDGRLALVTNNGFIKQSLTVVDTVSLAAVDTVASLGFSSLFIGVALSPDGRTGYASGHSGNDDVIWTVALTPGPTMKFGKSIVLPRGSFAAGLAMSPDGSRLYVAENLANAVAVIDTRTKAVLMSIPVGRQPWGIAVHPTLPRVYVTNRVDRTVSIIDTESMAVIDDPVPTGNGPNAIAVSPNGAKIFVANATSDDLTVFDVDRPAHPRQLALTPFAGALPGSAPDALAFSPDGARLYVANAWDNDLAVIAPDTETLEGLLPTGFYPSGVAVSPDNHRLYVINMKGPRTYPRTDGRQHFDFFVNQRFDGTYGVFGTLQVMGVPNDAKLGLLDRRVRSNNGFDTGVRPGKGPAPSGPCSPIPCNVGDPSPIKHVVFIVRENKTYDQDLGDVPQGDGEPSYVLYGQQITPNLHALVNEFVLMDRLFADSEKSEPGHQWCTAAIDSDYIEKTWTADGRPLDIDVHVPPVSQPEGLYWFDNCYTHGVSFRKYGDFTRTDASGTMIPYWVANTDFNYRDFDLDYHDQARFEEWKSEFDAQVATDTFPQFTYILMPNDHTKGTQAGEPDPRSFVAENDYATAEIVEAVSHSPYWRETVIFMVEDDPQSGVDHVDSHRTVGFVVGPYVRRHYVSHTRYDMASIHKTMELILGLPPMSQFDQMAAPMRDLFIDTDTPDTTPYTTLPPQYPFIMARPNRYARLSARQDWSRPDRVPDALLNKILWDYLKGPGRDG